ncbi:MAG: glutamate-5-semialdehyde dehydrogenase [Desulfobacteraceae bacterium]|nr:MAG: glutamate-5-semialdehyde dehydrogenase [Desulfobacteraceae bacterium]
MTIKDRAAQAKKASILMAATAADIKNNALHAIARALTASANEIIAANQADLDAAAAENLAAPLLKRLKFQKDKIQEAVEGIGSLISLVDPVGVTLSATELDRGLELYKVSSPIGVIGIVFESRPDALVQISSLCLKSGNAVMMKGGSEAAHTNRILSEIIHTAGISAGLPRGWLTLLEARSDVSDMLKLDHSIDLIIPRGSNEFVRYIMDNTTIPVLGHADGICHVYIDKKADVDMAVKVSVDSKCQYVAVCNAAETLLVHREIAQEALPVLQTALESKGVEIRGCEETRKIIAVKPATEEDWRTEYLDLILSVKIIDSMDAAIDHINTFGSGHTDAIVTTDKSRGKRFMDKVDSADVFMNCSTRFADGFRFGLGAEVGISTSKIHARGPVGLEGLMIYKWRLVGDGHVVSDYSGPNARAFSHKPLKKQFDESLK